MVLAYISLFGVKIYNYALALIILSLCVRVVRMFVAKVGKKQSKRSAEYNKKIVELRKETNNEQELADKIYDYYQENNYNPILNFLLKFLVFVLDFAILTAAVASFKPITNFKIISESSANSIISIYKENEGTEANRYTEIRLLKDLNKYSDQYRAAGVSEDEINTLQELKNTFKFGNLETYIIPSMNEFSAQMLPCLFAFILFAVNSLWSLIIQIKNLKKVKFTDPDIFITDKISALIGPIISVLCLVLVCTFIFKVPIVISFYFLINYGWSLIEKIIQTIKKQKKKKNGAMNIETENSVASK